MDNRNITVALIFGGAGVEHGVSVMGADNLIGMLRSRGLRVIPTLIRRDGGWLTADTDATAEEMEHGRCRLLPTFPIRLADERGLLVNGGILRIDAAIPLLHGDRGEDGRVQGLLDCAGIPYIGCDTLCGAVCSDKAFTKLIARDLGIPTARGIYSTECDTPERLAERAVCELTFPMFVKPTRLGSSVGASAVYREDQLSDAISRAYRLGSGRVIVEELVQGARELECAVFSQNGKLLFTNIGEISYETGFYDYDTKYSSHSGVRILTSARISPEQRAAVLEYSRAIAQALGIKGLSRIDYLLDGNGEIYFNEINTFPGMTERSMFARLIEAEGTALPQLLDQLIREAVG